MIAINITEEEKLMYQVMGAVYRSRVPVDFKGAMVLRAYLLEAGYPEETRHTADIDGNWNSDSDPSAGEMTEKLQKAFEENKINLAVNMYRRYGKRRSAGFELAEKKTGEVLFSMDIDVNRTALHTKIYEIDGIMFSGSSPLQMTADKVMSVSTDKIFRRIKDLVDIYYIQKVFEFDCNKVLKLLENRGQSLEAFYGFLHRTDELKHAYEKFRFSGNADKPSFGEVYYRVREYIRDILPETKNNF